MTKKFSVLRANMKPDSQLRAETNAKQLLAELPPNELIQAPCYCKY